MWRKITDIICGKSSNRVREIKWFSGSGKGMPSGATFHKGSFLVECRKNEKKFVTEGIAGEQYGLANYRGGVIVFATSVNSVELSKNKIANKAKQLWHSFLNSAMKDKKLNKCIDSYNKDEKNADDLIGAFSVGNAFKGKYVDIDTGKVFNDRSYTIEIGGLSSNGLLDLAERIANEFEQQTVLVKDFNNNKFYLADGIKSDDEPDFSNVNTMVDSTVVDSTVVDSTVVDSTIVESKMGIEYISDVLATCEHAGINAIADDNSGKILFYNPKDGKYTDSDILRDADWDIDSVIKDKDAYEEVMQDASGEGFKQFAVEWNGLEKKDDKDNVFKTSNCAPIHGNFI